MNGVTIYTLKTKRNHQKKTGFANITRNDKQYSKTKYKNQTKKVKEKELLKGKGQTLEQEKEKEQ